MTPRRAEVRMTRNRARRRRIYTIPARYVAVTDVVPERDMIPGLVIRYRDSGGMWTFLGPDGDACKGDLREANPFWRKIA